MSTVTDQLQNVTPGDLIEAAFFNKLLVVMRNLDQRVTSLEADTSTSPPSNNATITSLDPDDEIAVGQELRVFGTNFGLLAGAAQAWVGSTKITGFKQGSTNNLLIFDIPDLTETLPAQLGVTAGNQFSTQQRAIVVNPRPIDLVGGVTVGIGTADPAAVPPGTDVFWPITLLSEASKAGTYTITASVDQTAWQPGVRVLETKASTTNLASVPLTPHVEKQLFVKVPIPSDGAGKKFRLTISVASGAHSGGSSVSSELTVGTGGPPVDTSIIFATPVASPSNRWNPTTNTATVAPAASPPTVSVSFNVHFTVVGQYDVTTALGLATPGSWTITPGMGNPPNPVNVIQSQIDAGGADQVIGFTLRAVTAGANTDTAEIKVQRRGQVGTPSSRSLVINLRNA